MDLTNAWKITGQGAHATFSFVDVHVKTGAAMGLDEIWKRYNA